MSTIATQLNWGASYIVNDFYRRFLVKGQNEKHYVRISQFATILLMIISSITTYYQNSISGAWKFLIAVGAGTGSVSIVNGYGIKVPAFTKSGTITGTLGNIYGVYVNDQSGQGFTTDHNIYSAGANSKNVFEGKVSIGTATPNANAILDVSSTTKAFMPPRMTTTQRDAIPSPTAGMVIYNTTTNKLNVYTIAWEAVTSV